MTKEELEKSKKRILTLEKEIENLSIKREELDQLREQYFEDYFRVDRGECALLTDIPKNPTRITTNPLCPYSTLNVDEIGKLICKLAHRYDGEELVSKRVDFLEKCENAFGPYYEEYPVLVVGKKEEVEDINRNENNIVIEFNPFYAVKDYPTDKPVCYIGHSNGDNKVRSNYNKLIGYYDGLTFDNKGRSYIEDLIYSLAYYQSRRGIMSMSAEETKDVYKRIFKKN